jgi:hypothetical protein
LDDVVVGAYSSDADGTDAGRAYVVFGRTATTAVELSNLGTNGFVVEGQAANRMTGFSVSSAGDFNGDGLDDLVVGAPNANSWLGNPTLASRSYLVYGKNNSNVVDLAALQSSQGFAISGPTAEAMGYQVSSLGDFDGDGFDDIALGAPLSDVDASDRGRVYVVYGSSNTTAVDTANLGTQGIVLTLSGGTGTRLGLGVSAAGDVNGDGLADLLTTRTSPGGGYVVFGSATRSNVTADSLGARGFSVNAGYNTISTAGDFNGDGLADLIAYHSEMNFLKCMV